MELNTEQKKVVYSHEPFLFLLAGAGSGKTRVIIEKIKYLISKGVPPNSILAITFTKKASLEMKHRMHNENVHIHTFHQFCYIHLKEVVKNGFEVLDNQSIVFNRKDKLLFSRYKNSFFQEKKPNRFDEYQALLKEQHLKDFDDLLIDYYQYLISYKKKHHYHYIFIDEFQDTNRLQYMLLKEIIGEKTKVLAVGDPDQSIYQFRGAMSSIIDLFIKDYDAKIYTLLTNYRSSKDIVYHANRLIKRNNRRHKKELVSVSHHSNQVFRISFDDTRKEAIDLCKLIQYFQKKGIKQSEIAILYRNNDRAYQVQVELLDQNIFFQSADQDDHFLEGIQLMTIHKAKGLEFDVVIIIGLEQGELPSHLDYRQKIIDEERRLMFVAMTRARHFLYLTSVKRNEQNQTFTSSRFIRESGVKPIPRKHFNDIISLGDLNGKKTKNHRTDEYH